MNYNDRDFRLPWTKPITKQEWKTFLDFNFGNESRPIAYSVVSELVSAFHGVEFLEIGFGQCYDFINCFKPAHDSGSMVYSGVDITEQFAKYAKEEYPEYRFGVGGFMDIDKDYDIIYTSQTLEHQHPYEFEHSISNMLNHSKVACVIVWFQSPRPDGYNHWSSVDGFGGEGAWVNRYNSDVVKNIIEGAGFRFTIHKANEDRSIYVCERDK